MKSIVFDTGPIISLAMNNLLWLLEPLKIQFDGSFFITPIVKNELVDKPLQTKKFKFEAVQVMQTIQEGVLEVIENKNIHQTANRLFQLANTSFYAGDHYISIVHFGDMEGIAAAHDFNASTYVVDERTTRTLIEDPHKLANILQHKLHTSISVNQKNLKSFLREVGDIRMLRSFELVVIAYELGLLDRYILNIPSSRKTLLDGILWGIKLNGCAVSVREIDEVIKLESKI